MRDSHKRKVAEIKRNIDQLNGELKREEEAVVSNEQKGKALEQSLKSHFTNKQIIQNNVTNGVGRWSFGGGGSGSGTAGTSSSSNVTNGVGGWKIRNRVRKFRFNTALYI